MSHEREGDSIVLEEEIDPNYEPNEAEVLEYAKWLGMDTDAEKDLFWIAREGLKAPLPENWKPCKTTDTGEIYYFNFQSGESTWDHPCDDFYRKLYEEHKKKRFSQSGKSMKGNNDEKRKKEKEDVAEILGKNDKKKKKSVPKLEDLGELKSKLDRKPLPGILLSPTGSDALSPTNESKESPAPELRKADSFSAKLRAETTSDVTVDTKPKRRGLPLPMGVGSELKEDGASRNRDDELEKSALSSKRKVLGTDHVSQDSVEKEVGRLRQQSIKDLEEEMANQRKEYEKKWESEKKIMEKERLKLTKEYEEYEKEVYSKKKSMRKEFEEKEREHDRLLLTRQQEIEMEQETHVDKFKLDMKKKYEEFQDEMEKNYSKKEAKLRKDYEDKLQTIERDFSKTQQKKEEEMRVQQEEYESEWIRKFEHWKKEKQLEITKREKQFLSSLESSKLADLQEDIKELNSSYKKQIDGLKSELHELRSQNDELEKENTMLQTKNKSNADSKDREEVRSLEIAQSSLKEEKKKIEIQLREVERQKSGLAEELTTLRKSMEHSSHTGETNNRKFEQEIELLKEQLKDLKNQQTLHNDEINKQLEKEISSKKELQMKLELTQARLDSLTTVSAKDKEKYEIAIQSMEKSLRTSQENEQKNERLLEDMKSQLKKNQRENDLLRGQMELLQSHSSTAGDDKSSPQQQTKNFDLQINNLKNQINALEAEKAEVEKSATQLQRDNSQYKYTLEAANNRVKSMSDEVQRLKHEKEEIESEVQRLKKENMQRQQGKEKTMSEIQSLPTLVSTKSLEEMLTLSKKELASNNAWTSKLQAENEALMRKVVDLQQAAERAQNDFESLKLQVTALEGEKIFFVKQYSNLLKASDATAATTATAATVATSNAFVEGSKKQKSMLEDLEHRLHSVQDEKTDLEIKLRDCKSVLVEKEKQIRLFKVQIENLEQEVSHECHEKLLVQDRLQRMSHQHTELEQTYNANVDEMNEVHVKLTQTMSERSELVTRLQRIEDEKLEYAQRIDDLTSDRNNIETHSRSSMKNIQAMQDKVERLHAQLEQKETELRQAFSTRSEMEGKTRQLHAQLLSLQGQIESLEHENEEKNRQVVLITEQKQKMIERAKASHGTLEELQRQLHEAQDRLGQLERDLMDTKEAHDSLERKNKNGHLEYEKLSKKYHDLSISMEQQQHTFQRQNQDLIQKTEHLEEEKTRWQEKIETIAKRMETQHNTLQDKEKMIQDLNSRVTALTKQKDELQTLLLTSSNSTTNSQKPRPSTTRLTSDSVATEFALPPYVGEGGVVTKAMEESSIEVFKVKNNLLLDTKRELDFRLCEVSQNLEEMTHQKLILETRSKEQNALIESMRVDLEVLKSLVQSVEISRMEALNQFERVSYSQKKLEIQKDYQDRIHEFNQHQEDAFLRKKARTRAQYERQFDELIENLEKKRAAKIKHEKQLTLQEVEALRSKKRDELRQIDHQANSELNQEIAKTQKRKMQKLENLEKQLEKEEDKLRSTISDVKQLNQEEDFIHQEIHQKKNKIKKEKVLSFDVEREGRKDWELNHKNLKSLEASSHGRKNGKWHARVMKEKEFLRLAYEMLHKQKRNVKKQQSMLKSDQNLWKNNAKSQKASGRIKSEMKHILDQRAKSLNANVQQIRETEKWLHRRKEKVDRLEKNVQRLSRASNPQRMSRFHSESSSSSPSLSSSSLSSPSSSLREDDGLSSYGSITSPQPEVTDEDDEDDEEDEEEEEKVYNQFKEDDHEVEEEEEDVDEAQVLERLRQIASELNSDASRVSSENRDETNGDRNRWVQSDGLSDVHPFPTSSFPLFYSPPWLGHPVYSHFGEEPRRYVEAFAPQAQPSPLPSPFTIPIQPQFPTATAAATAAAMYYPHFPGMTSMHKWPSAYAKPDARRLGPFLSHGSQKLRMYQKQIASWANDRSKVQKAASKHASWLGHLCREVHSYAGDLKAIPETTSAKITPEVNETLDDLLAARDPTRQVV